MNKIPKCSRGAIPMIPAHKKLSKDIISNKIKISSNKSMIRSFGDDISNFNKNHTNKIPKKSSSYNEKVRTIIYNNL